jgi:hypothetical protein
MKKRDKKLSIAKETLYALAAGRDLKAALGGANPDVLSCTYPPSTAGGSSIPACC